MTTIDDFFQATPDPFVDPQVRDWRSRLGRPGTTATLEVYWPELLVGQTQAEMSVRFTENGKTFLTEPTLWDDDLNADLIGLRVRAADVDQEAIRFSLGLRAALRRVERDFGGGYLSAVLFSVIQKSGLSRHQLIAPFLDTMSLPGLDHEKFRASYLRCQGMVEAAIQGRAHELTDSLGYPLDEAKKILVAALARYLDRRFSISIRRERGLL